MISEHHEYRSQVKVKISKNMKCIRQMLSVLTYMYKLYDVFLWNGKFRTDEHQIWYSGALRPT